MALSEKINSTRPLSNYNSAALLHSVCSISAPPCFWFHTDTFSPGHSASSGIHSSAPPAGTLWCSSPTTLTPLPETLPPRNKTAVPKRGLLVRYIAFTDIFSNFNPAQEALAFVYQSVTSCFLFLRVPIQNAHCFPQKCFLAVCKCMFNQQLFDKQNKISSDFQTAKTPTVAHIKVPM